ncbi:MAG: prephenate dehydrogenase [Bacillales bacterium]|nr:prephenate dehydrogenase [Bacillales bacterium]
MKLLKKSKILIVGLGLIGGSYAAALTKKGYQVYALTKEEESIEFAKAHNYIIDGKTKVDEEFISSFDIVIFSLYPKIFISWMKEYHTYFKEGTYILDVTGVKGSIVYEIQDIIKNDKIEFIPTHPMAGREVYGVQNAKYDLFIGANYIITPTDKNTKEGIELAKEIGSILGFKNISILTPEKHDEMIAFLSQLTHCIAVSLMTCKDSLHLKEYTGDSFRDLTRIANINENMWSELFLMNKKELLAQMDLFIREFKKLRDAIESNDVETMKDMMRLSTKRRSYFNK